MLQHKHLILSGELLEPPIDEVDLKAFLKRLVDYLGMKTLSEPVAVLCEEPGNVGMTGFVLLTTSHIAWHDWSFPEEHFKVQLDIYTCGALDPAAVVKFLDDNLFLTKYTYRVFDREYAIEEIASGGVG